MGLMGVGYGFVILAAIISFAAQMYVQSAYSKYSQVDTFEHLSGAQVARRILDLKNIDDVQVVESSGGELSDHYDPTKKSCGSITKGLSRNKYCFSFSCSSRVWSCHTTC